MKYVGTGRQLNALRRQSRLLNMSAKMNVFNAFARANLNYYPIVWINRGNKAINSMSPPYIQDLFKEKDISHDLRISKILVTTISKSITHGINSLRYQRN